MSLRANLRAAIGCGLLLLIFAETGWLAWLNKSATFDEPPDLFDAWVQTHDLDFRCNPEEPPLMKYYAVAGTAADGLRIDRASPLWEQLRTDRNVSVPMSIDTLYHNRANDPDALFRQARARMIVLGIVLGALIAWWAWRLAGPLAGVVAAAAFCLDPNFLANAPLVKDDVPMSLCFAALMAVIWLAGERATIWRCIGIGLMLGIALSTKFSGLLAFPILALALLVRALLPAAWPVAGFIAGTRMQRLISAAAIYLAALLIGYCLLWAAYVFRYSPAPDPRHDFDLNVALDAVARRQSILAHGAPMIVDPPQIREWMRSWHPDLLVRLAQWADFHRLLPQAWTYGLLIAYSASHIRLAFLCGQSSFAGWWYYFPLAMLFKTPLATLIALALGLVVFCAIRAKPTNLWPLCAAVIAPTLYMAMSLRSHLNIGLRHVLPIYPFLFIFLGVGAAAAYRRWPRPSRWIIGAFILCLGLESLSAFPNFIPFFNIAAGGSRGGLRLLGDSNIDWGQELPDLAQWQERHPDHLLYLAYFGTADPHYYGIRYLDLSQAPPPARQSPSSSAPPVYAISAALLQIPYPNQSTRDFYASLLRRPPIAVLGGSLYLFDAR
jgi:4-amino-4-deoxy-L-arabinose transferase-like glycosyltransferase